MSARHPRGGAAARPRRRRHPPEIARRLRRPALGIFAWHPRGTRPRRRYLEGTTAFGSRAARDAREWRRGLARAVAARAIVRDDAVKLVEGRRPLPRPRRRGRPARVSRPRGFRVRAATRPPFPWTLHVAAAASSRQGVRRWHFGVIRELSPSAGQRKNRKTCTLRLGRGVAAAGLRELAWSGRFAKVPGRTAARTLRQTSRVSAAAAPRRSARPRGAARQVGYVEGLAEVDREVVGEAARVVKGPAGGARVGSRRRGTRKRRWRADCVKSWSSAMAIASASFGIRSGSSGARPRDPGKNPGPRVLRAGRYVRVCGGRGGLAWRLCVHLLSEF